MGRAQCMPGTLLGLMDFIPFHFLLCTRPCCILPVLGYSACLEVNLKPTLELCFPNGSAEHLRY